MKNKITSFVKQNWKSLLEGLGLIAILLSLLQLNLQQKQFALEQQQFTAEQSLKPNLVYDYHVSLSDTDNKLIEDYATRIVEDFFDKIYSEKSNNPEDEYADILDRILPLTISVPSKNLILTILVQNQGLTTANSVHVRFDIARPITKIEVDALEPNKLIDGGIGNNKATINIARIIPNGRVLITVTSDRLPNEKQDKLSIDFSQRGRYTITFQITSGVPPYTLQIQPQPTTNASNKTPAILHDSSFFSSINYLPTINYVSSSNVEPQIYVSSDEGGATQTILITPTSTP